MMITTKISGMGMYIPACQIDNNHVLNLLKKHSEPYFNVIEEDIDAFIDSARDKIERAGCKFRYWCLEEEYCTDIALAASKEALNDAGLSAKDIDLIIFTGMSKAFIEPATAHVLRYELGAINANVIDTQDACTSFIKSMQIADSLIVNGAYKTILIAAGERTSDWADFVCKTKEELSWKIGSLTIADAAGAIIMQATEDPEYVHDRTHMKFFYKLTNEKNYAICTVGLNHTVGVRDKALSHSNMLLNKGYRVMKDLIVSIFANELKGMKIDLLLAHDIGNMVPLTFHRVHDECNIAEINPDLFLPVFPELGNLASASLPVNLTRAKREGRLQRGQKVAFFVPAAGLQAGIMTFKY